jgi:hypothetical protein
MTRSLNETSNYLIDWRRPGSLLFSNHRYSQKEWAERIFVAGSTALAGYWQWCDSQDMKDAGIAATIGFLLSHTLTMSPLILKRLKNKWACDELIVNIRGKTHTESPEFKKLIESAIQKILQHAESKSASAVWGDRARLLTNLSVWLDQNNAYLSETLNQEDIINLLNTPSIDEVGGLQLRIRP